MQTLELEQPPPGPDHLVELPPPGWRGISPRKFRDLCIFGGMLVAAAFVLLGAFTRRTHCGCGMGRVNSINNAKQVGLALLEFEQEYGSFPSDATVAAVVRDTGSFLDFTDGSSNAMFRQLLAFGVESEDIFHTQHPEGTTWRPDNLIGGPLALAPGEVGFSYVHGLDTSCDPETPVLLSPMRSGTDRCWEDKDLENKVIVLRMDYSAVALPIRSSDQKAVVSGVPILDASQPYFHGKWPDLRHPRF